MLGSSGEGGTATLPGPLRFALPQTSPARCDRSGGTVPPVNLVELLLATGRPDAGALSGPSGDVTYAELGSLTGRQAALLLDAGVEPGDRVGVASANDVAFVVGYLGALHAGAVVVPLNPSAPPAELERELAAVGPRLVLAAGPAIGMSGAAGASVRSIELDALPDRARARVERADDDVAVLLFTSGTAGTPKAAMLTHGNLASNIRQVQDHPGLALRADDVGLAVLPFHHVFGLNVTLGMSLAGRRASCSSPASTRSTPRTRAAEHRVTVLAGVPTMFSSWLELGDDEVPADAFRSVRLAVSGAAPLRDDVGAAFARALRRPYRPGLRPDRGVADRDDDRAPGGSAAAGLDRATAPRRGAAARGRRGRRRAPRRPG